MPRGNHGNHVRADKQWRWADGRQIMSTTGYVKVHVGRGHPLADHPNGYAYEHLVVWCAAGFQRPTREHLLHHKNEVKTDNRLENLALITRAEHNRLHAPPRDSRTGRLLPKAAGATLDGREWREMPGVTHG